MAATGPCFKFLYFVYFAACLLPFKNNYCHPWFYRTATEVKQIMVLYYHGSIDHTDIDRITLSAFDERQMLYNSLKRVVHTFAGLGTLHLPC